MMSITSTKNPQISTLLIENSKATTNTNMCASKMERMQECEQRENYNNNSVWRRALKETMWQTLKMYNLKQWVSMGGKLGFRV